MATKEETYNAAIRPLMNIISKVCREAKINMAATFALEGAPCVTYMGSADPDDVQGLEYLRSVRERMIPAPSEMLLALLQMAGVTVIDLGDLDDQKTS